jgi:hypothetical protein
MTVDASVVVHHHQYTLDSYPTVVSGIRLRNAGHHERITNETGLVLTICVSSHIPKGCGEASKGKATPVEACKAEVYMLV